MRTPDPRVISIGSDFRDYPREFWGTRDRARARAEDRARALLQASRPLPAAFGPLPGPPVSFSVNPLRLDAPVSSAERRRLGLPPRHELDARLAKLGIRPRSRRRS
jgi:hypothetical protein